jgi:hypothetical protein
VINVPSHRHCTAEVESAIVSNERVAEGRRDRAQRGHRLGDHGIRHAELAPTTAKRRHKSGSGKILLRLLRDIAERASWAT